MSESHQSEEEINIEHISSNSKKRSYSVCDNSLF